MQVHVLQRGGNQIDHLLRIRLLLLQFLHFIEARIDLYASSAPRSPNSLQRPDSYSWCRNTRILSCLPSVIERYDNQGITRGAGNKQCSQIRCFAHFILEYIPVGSHFPQFHSRKPMLLESAGRQADCVHIVLSDQYRSNSSVIVSMQI